MTRKEFVCAAVLKYLERPEIMYTVANPDADRAELIKIAEATLQFARCYTTIEASCVFAADEAKEREGDLEEAREQRREARRGGKPRDIEGLN